MIGNHVRSAVVKIRFIYFLAILLIFFGISAHSNPIDHTTYDTLLQKYVENGMVDYGSLKTDRGLLINYLEQIESVDPEDFKTWSVNEQKAFWINVYNAITIEGIIRNYPIQYGGLIARTRFPKSSIRQIGKFWDTVFIKVMGKDLTLNDIEHNILRKEFDDPRIHFVLVCAAMGCPILENRAFFVEDLDERLDRAAFNFITNPEKVRLDREKNIIYLLSILEWYREDFESSESAGRNFGEYGKKERGVIEFVSRFMSETDREFIVLNLPKIKYLSYDWSLNEKQ